jgi:hypothetical protein
VPDRLGGGSSPKPFGWRPRMTASRFGHGRPSTSALEKPHDLTQRRVWAQTTLRVARITKPVSDAHVAIDVRIAIDVGGAVDVSVPPAANMSLKASARRRKLRARPGIPCGHKW